MAVDNRFIVSLKGKQHVLYPGLLGLAHDRGIKELTTRLIQVPSPENASTAIVEATVVFQDDSRFTDIGDASPANTGGQMVTALLRLASTRAKGRVLRDGCNVGEALLEDADADDAPHPAQAPPPRQQSPPQAVRPAQVQPPPPRPQQQSTPPPRPLPPNVDANGEIHETPPPAGSYAEQALKPPVQPVEQDEANRHARAVAKRKVLLEEASRRRLWVSREKEMAPFIAQEFDAETAENLEIGSRVLEQILIADDQERVTQPQPVAGEGPAVCEVCTKPLTSGQLSVSRAKFNADLCPIHQRERQPAAA